MTRHIRPFRYRRTWMKFGALGALGAIAPFVAGGMAADAAESQPQVSVATRVAAASTLDPELERVRAATIKYQDVDVALADGYERDPSDMCDTADMMGRAAEDGVMGIHYVRPDLLGITGPPNPRVNGTGTHTDFLQPAVLIYEPQEDGALELVAVENLVFIAAWEAAGHTEPPVFMGRSYDRMVDDPSTAVDEAHMFEPHYDLHVWLFRDNPRGIFAQFNPNATCAHHKGGGHAH